MTDYSFTLQQLADELGAAIQGYKECVIHSLGTLQSAAVGQLAFIANANYRKYLETTAASAVIISPDDQAFYAGNAIISSDPYLAYARLSQLFSRPLDNNQGVSQHAIIDPTAIIPDSANVSAGAVVSKGVVLAEHVEVGPNPVVGPDCRIGANTRLEANVTLYADVHLGECCLVHSGAVIGADGFGFAKEKDCWVKIAQLGGVRIGDNVEVGAGTTIDRGALEHTVIENGVILDNQIQIAHNVRIGENSAIAGCTAVAGSTRIGDRCTIAGACGITGHLEIADDVHITAMTLVTKSISKPGAYSSGTGFMPHTSWKKNVVRFRKLDELARRLKSVEDRIEEIKGS